jgi:holo-[acyl-carrier protein] synthase
MTIGTDIAEVDRIKKLLSTHGDFISRVFTKQEIEYCQGKKNKYQHFAARFAAKESVMKAVGKGWLQGLNWTDIEVINLPSGEPRINPRGALKKLMKKIKITSFMVSLSHCKEYAIAMVVAQ